MIIINSFDVIVVGRFPESENIEELIHKLYNGIDMVTSNAERYSPHVYDLPARKGVLRNIENFDANFFNMAPKQVHKTDPQLRLLLEVTYEAFVDAGVNPAIMAGSKTGVYIGACNSEADDYWSQDRTADDGKFSYILFLMHAYSLGQPTKYECSLLCLVDVIFCRFFCRICITQLYKGNAC